MAKYIVTPQHVYDPETIVYYAYSFEGAVSLADQKSEETGKSWIVAMVYEPSLRWFDKLLFKLARLTNGD